MNDLQFFIAHIKNTPEKTEFEDVINLIDNYYDYTPTRFTNGLGSNEIINPSGSNEGSCKIFSFAHLHKLSKLQTLYCFGKFYREDVLNNPMGTAHANIRNFIIYGWENIHFEANALKPKT